MKLHVFGALLLAAGALSATVNETEALSKRGRCGSCSDAPVTHDPSHDNDSPGCKSDVGLCWASCDPTDKDGKTGTPNHNEWHSNDPWCYLTKYMDAIDACTVRQDCEILDTSECLNGNKDKGGCWGTP